MLFLMPNQQCQRAEGKHIHNNTNNNNSCNSTNLHTAITKEKQKNVQQNVLAAANHRSFQKQQRIRTEEIQQIS